MINKGYKSIQFLMHANKDSIWQRALLMNALVKTIRPLIDTIIPWLKSAEIIYFDGKTLIFNTYMPEIRHKGNMLRNDLIKKLQCHPSFNQLEELKIILIYS